jgi:hypothetical protein
MNSSCCQTASQHVLLNTIEEKTADQRNIEMLGKKSNRLLQHDESRRDAPGSSIKDVARIFY